MLSFSSYSSKAGKNTSNLNSFPIGHTLYQLNRNLSYRCLVYYNLSMYLSLYTNLYLAQHHGFAIFLLEISRKAFCVLLKATFYLKSILLN